jgi:transposase-like protein
MQCITRWTEGQRDWGAIAHTIAVLGLVLLLAMGCAPESLGGWVGCPIQGGGAAQAGRQAGRQQYSRHGWAWRLGWTWLRRNWSLAVLRSEALLALVLLTGRREWDWACLLPWLAWLWKGLGLAWPGLGRQPLYAALGQLWDRVTGTMLIGLGLTWLSQHPGGSRPPSIDCCLGMLPLGLCSSEESGKASVKVTQDEAGVYQVRLQGEFFLRVDGTVEVYKRLLVIFLGLLEVPDETRSSRRTRDGRTPFVRQEQMAEWAGVPHPVISRWLGYWLAQDWRRLLSQRWGEVLTLEVQQRIIDSWALHPWWTPDKAWQHLRSQGSAITLNQVKQAGRESGWAVVRQKMISVYRLGPDSFRPRDEWLTRQLLAQIQQLLSQLEALGGLPTEQQVALAALETLCEELGLRPAEPRRALPWVLQVEQWLFGHWEWVEDGRVQCIYCGSNDVSRKSRKPRLKKYVDAQGQVQTVEVYRYYCHNPGCRYETFTHLPPHLLPYSRRTVDHHLAALQLYEWSHSVYRCTAQMLGVSKMTAYRWVSGFGYGLLPVAALFGVVRFSGVVGVDEKYVLVPKNDKPESDMKRWMYVYVAVDCYTYDLLHIELYPYNTKESAHAFLLALRAKGYHPRVIVTDMRVDYEGVIAQVFPRAVHHECIFHALQQVHKHFKDVYGRDYAQTCPSADTLRAEIDRIFDARTKRTAQRRYEQVLAQREKFVAETPATETIFAFLENHWPRLVNAIESRQIPTTNNATEEVIRIFTQHYKTFCGFDNIESARLYLAVFEKIYRFTPFSDDAQARIRSKCPLELAGYEMPKLPMARLFRGLALQWPAAAFKELVPNE